MLKNVDSYSGFGSGSEQTGLKEKLARMIEKILERGL